jgi:hypothetical protein
LEPHKPHDLETAVQGSCRSWPHPVHDHPDVAFALRRSPAHTGCHGFETPQAVATIDQTDPQHHKDNSQGVEIDNFPITRIVSDLSTTRK